MFETFDQNDDEISVSSLSGERDIADRLGNKKEPE